MSALAESQRAQIKTVEYRVVEEQREEGSDRTEEEPEDELDEEASDSDDEESGVGKIN